MTRGKRRPSVIVQMPEDDDNYDGPLRPPKPNRTDEHVSPEDMAMQEAVAGLAEGERYVKLYRVNDQGGRPRFLAHMLPEDFNEMGVSERFGGGRFFGRWKEKVGGWKRYPFEIEGEPLLIRQRVGQSHEVAGGVESEPTVLPGYEMQPVAVQPPESNQIRIQDVLALMAQAEERSFRRMEMILELTRPTEKPPQPATEQVFSLVEKIVPLIQSGGEGGGNPWLFVLSQLKEPLTKIVDSIHAAAIRQPVPAAAPASGGPGTAVVPPKAIEQPKAEDPDMILAYLKQVLPILVNGANRNADPAFYADLVLDQIPTTSYTRLRDWLNASGCLDRVAQLEPGIRFQQDWWEQLRVALIDALTGAPDDAGPVQSAQDPRSSASHATARSPVLDTGEGSGD